MAIDIECYSGDFKEQIVELIVTIQTKEFSVAITAEDQPDLFNIETFYQRGAGNFWIARDGDRVVGTVALIDIGERRGALRKMFVLPEYRGKERLVAKHLLDNLLYWASEQGLAEILLGTTSQYHAAHRFYEKHGFSEVEKSSLPSSFPIMEVDSKFYRKMLNC